MAPSKCNYLVFSKTPKCESEKLCLKLLNQKMTINNNPTFLGVRFDHHLNFNNQVNYIKDTCNKRLNIIKILSNKTWSLSEKTLIQLYNSLTRSIIEYSSIIYPCLSKTNWCLLESIQKKSLKIVLKLPRDTSNKIYEEKIINIENLKLRLDKLNEKYLQNCITNENEIIIDLLKNYLNFSNARCLKYKTLFCNYVKFLKNLY
jgi:hypothetical protein